VEPAGSDVPLIEFASGTDHALALLAEARQRCGGVRAPDGELYELPPELDAVVTADPWRARLTPWALRAITDPDEAWLFRGGEPTEEPIEHRPHIVIGRPAPDAPACAVEVGTRRVDGRMRIQTWYRIVHPLPLFDGYWQGAVRCWPPARALRAHDDRVRDVLILSPDPAEPWDGHWLPGPTGFLLLERAGLPVPIWIGMEIHEFRAAWRQLAAHPPFAVLMASDVTIDGGQAAPLADQLRALAETI
jgi:hypothetical protein